MDLFDSAIFDSAVFDTGAVVATGGSRGGGFFRVGRQFRIEQPGEIAPPDDNDVIICLLMAA